MTSQTPESEIHSPDTQANVQDAVQEQTGPPTDIVTDLRDLLDQDAVMVPIARGEKGPRMKGWQDLTTAAMSNPLHLAQLLAGNIGVLLGAPSNGLCSIDIDDDSMVEPFLDLNPRFRETLQTRGARGRNIWIRVVGEYPKLTKLYSCSMGDDDQEPKAWGEWRATGGQTVIFGRHPTGKKYEIINRKKPIEVTFDKIVWPNDLDLSWELELYNKLVREHGEPYALGKQGAVQLNQPFHVAKFAEEHLVLHEPEEKKFYSYSEERGLWQQKTAESTERLFAEDLKTYADSQGLSQIERLRNNALLTGLTKMLRGKVEKSEAFKHRPEVIHVGNGMLHLDTEPPELRQFSPSCYSRNQCPIPIVPDADCLKFKEILLAPALDADDISLLQRWCGSVLLGCNHAQRIMLLTGTAGGGKSTLVEVVESVIGEDNVTELRTDFLNERFELHRYVGKTLLTGKDVPAEFLMRKSASTLKKLVGNDLLTPEGKSLNSAINIRGNFGAVITCNSRLRVRLEGDAGAWRRRLMVIEYNRHKPEKRIADFAQVLLKEESSGILNWMLEGAVAHLAELKNSGDFVLTTAQSARVDVLLAESDSVREFVRQCVRPGHPAAQIAVEELTQAYALFCDKNGWYEVARATVERQLPDLILEIHNVNKRHDLKTLTGTCRGFKGLEITPDYES